MGWLVDPAVLPWVNLATIVGVLVSLVGFGFTLWQVIRTRRTAERVEQATRETLHAVRGFDTLLAITTALEMLEELKQLHREGRWEVAILKYGHALRQVDLTRNTAPGTSWKTTGSRWSGSATR